MTDRPVGTMRLRLGTREHPAYLYQQWNGTSWETAANFTMCELFNERPTPPGHEIGGVCEVCQ